MVWYSNLFKTFPQFVVIHKVKGFQFSPSVMSDSLRPHGLQTPGFPVHHQLLKLAQTHVHLVGATTQPSHPLSSPSPPAFNLSQHQGLSNESVLHIRWPKYWRFSFSISPSQLVPIPSNPSSHNLHMDSMDLSVPDMSQKWNHEICDILYLASFI